MVSSRFGGQDEVLLLLVLRSTIVFPQKEEEEEKDRTEKELDGIGIVSVKKSVIVVVPMAATVAAIDRLDTMVHSLFLCNSKIEMNW